MTLKIDDIQDASWDARLELEPEKQKELLEEARMLFDKLNSAIDPALENVPPTYFPTAKTTKLREDLVHPSMPVNEALVNAHDADSQCFHVPRIIEE